METSDEVPAQVLGALLRSECNVQKGLLVGISGGIDSVVLLDCLSKISKKRALPLVAVHVDHGLRNESQLDAIFCARFARERNVPFRSEFVHIPPGKSIQARARVARYSALARARWDTGMGAICTAHHHDDAIETALINLTRGTGIAGLASLRPRRHMPSFNSEVIRPMLQITRNDIECYASRWTLPFRDDPSNADLRYLRNRVRHEVLPALHASSHGTLGFRTSLESLRRDSDALEEITNSAWSAALLQRPADTGIYIRRAILCEFPDAIVARVLHRAARSVGSTWSTSTLDHAMRDIRSGHQARICIRSGIVELSKQGIHVEFVQERGTRAVDTRSTQAIEVLGSKSGRIPWFDRSIAWSPFPESDSNPDPLGSHVCSIQTGRYFIQGPGEADTFSGPGQTTRRIRTILRRLDVAEHELWRWPCLFWESKDGSTRICQWIYGVADAGCETPTAAAEKSSNRVILSIDQRIANNLQPP